MSNKQDFESVIDDNSRKIYALCFRLAGNEADAEELVQQTFVKAYKAYEKFEGRSEVSTWLYRIAMNTWKTSLRGKNKTIPFQPDSENEGQLEPAGNDKNPEEQATGRERTEIVQRVLMSMPDEERELITLRDLQAQSYDEIASILDVPLGTVKSRLSRAREQLRIKITTVLKTRGEQNV